MMIQLFNYINDYLDTHKDDILNFLKVLSE